jgi:hypothetical protein
VPARAALRLARRPGRLVPGRRRASEVELGLVARRVLRDFYWHRGGVFYHIARRNGFVEALLRFFDECREGLATERALEEFVAALEAEGEPAESLRAARLRELAALYGRYERALAQLGLLDHGLSLRVALEAVRDARFPLPPELAAGRVVFRDIYDWSPIRVDLVRELARRLLRERDQGRLGFAEDHVEVHLPYDFDRPSLFHYLEPILRQIESLEGEALSICWDPDGGLRDAPDRHPGLEALARAIWSSAGGVRSRIRGQEGDTIDDLDADALTLIECASPAREARAVARRVRALLDGGAAPEEIVIAARELDAEVVTLGRALDQAGVPWRAERAAPLREAPTARLVLSLLRLAQQGWPREGLIEVLSSHYTAGLAPSPLERGPEGAHAIAALLREAGIRDDLSATGSPRSAYEDHLDRHLERLQRRVAQDRARRAALGAARPEDAWPVESLPEVAQARALRDRVAALRRALAQTFPDRRRRLAEHARALQRLLELLRLRECLELAPADDLLDPLAERLLRAQARDQRAALALERLLEDLIHSDELAFELQDAQPDQERAIPASVALHRDRFTAASLREFLASAGFGNIDALEEVEGTSWDVSLTLGEFADLLEHLLGSQPLPQEEARGACVPIVPIKSLAGCVCPHVLIVGLNHGRFPLTWRSRALFPDEDRLAFGRFEAAQARRWGVERHRMSFPLQCLPYQAGTADDVPIPARQSEEVLLFYFGLAAATQTLTLTWSNLDEAGRGWMRSIFIDEVYQRLPPALRVIQREEIDPIPPLERCAAPWEVVARFQLETLGDGVQARPPRQGADDLGALLSRRQPRLGEVALAALAERARHTASGLERDELPAWLSREALARYLGDLGPAHQPWLAEALAFDAERPLRARALDQFGACPSRFWFSELLHLRARPETPQDVTAAERAQVVQRLIQAAYGALQRAALLPLVNRPEEVQREAIKLARDAMQAALSQWEEAHNRAHPRLWERVGALCREMVHQLLERERRASPQDLVALPWRYGELLREGPRDSAPVEVSLGPGRAVYLAGRVDRISIGPGLSGGARLDIVAYGTGRADAYERRLSPERRLKTEHELPLSLLATADGLVPGLQASGEVQAPVLLTACYESIPEGKRTASIAAEVGAAQPRDGDLLEATRAHLGEVVAQMRAGRYPFATRDCAWCSFRDLCRRGTYPEAT